jgi:hypothetical protein
LCCGPCRENAEFPVVSPSTLIKKDEAILKSSLIAREITKSYRINMHSEGVLKENLTHLQIYARFTV